MKLHSLALYTLEPARFKCLLFVIFVIVFVIFVIFVTSVTKSDKALTDDVKNLRNVLQRPRFETMHQVLLPENVPFDSGTFA